MEPFCEPHATFSGRNFRCACILAVCVASTYLLRSPKPAHCEGEGISSELAQALRKYLSSDPAEETLGEQTIRRLGPSALPQLRAWVAKVRHDLDRVSSLLDRLEGRSGTTSPTRRMTVDEFLSQKLAECRLLVKQGDYAAAAALAEAASILDRSGPYAWEFRRLGRRAKERVVAAQILEPAVDSAKMCYEFGEKPRILFRLQNHDSKLARIQLDRGALGEISWTATTKCIDGSMRRQESRLPIRLEADLEQVLIGPGQKWERELELEIGKEQVPANCVVRVQIAGRFRPARWSVEKARDQNIGISMNTAEFWIVPAGEGELSGTPLEKLVVALFFKRLQSFFVAGQIGVWLGEEDAEFNESLVHTLIGALEQMDEETLRASARLLSEATGFDFGTDRARWQTWWKSVKKDRREIPKG